MKLYEYCVNKGNADIDSDGVITYVLANNINEACIKIRNILVETYREDFHKIVTTFENMYAICKDINSDDYYIPYMSIIVREENSSPDIDIKYLESKLHELSNVRKNHNLDISDIVKDLVIGVEYELVLFSDYNVIRRYEIVYTGYDTDIETYRRELSDYSHRDKNKFEFMSKVKIKGLNNGIVYTITSTPFHNFYTEYWENMYGITPVGFEDDPGYELDIHESELEKVEE